MINLILISTFLVLVYKTLVFFLSLILNRNDIADVSWGLSFILITIVSILYAKNYSLAAILVSFLVLIWGVRLAVRIFLRNQKKKEDYRYAKLREEKNFRLRSFFQVYVLQGLLAVLVSLPVIFAIYYAPAAGLSWLIYLGLLAWLIGFFFEAVGDYQLDKFLANPNNKGHVLQTGLWKYSRHPNYFGEIAMWWGIFLMAVSVPYGWVSVLGPVTITFLITKVSGIPMLEKKYAGNSEFEDYKKRTSVLIPLPNR